MKRIYKRVSENTMCNFMDKHNNTLKIDQENQVAYLDNKKAAYIKNDIFGLEEHYVLKELL